MFDTRGHRMAAAMAALIYVAVQSFQWFVFGLAPQQTGEVEALLQGPAPLNLARALTMLLSFIGLAYLFLVVCGIAAVRQGVLALMAFLCFLTFCVMEIQLRSVELFYIYLHLPERFLAETNSAAREALLAVPDAFGAITHALYFPLGLSWVLGSVLICFALGAERRHWLALFAFGLNAVRLTLRMIDSYLVGPRFDDLYSAVYLPLVFLTFIPIALWLWRGAPPAPGTSERRRPRPPAWERESGGGR